MPQVEDRLTDVMSAPLDSIVDANQQDRPAPSLVEAWDLPQADRAALARWGLPTLPGMRTSFQEDSIPILVPNVAGEHERCLISPDQRLYKLIHWGREESQLRIGAVAGTGRVLSVRPRPLTAADVPAVLAKAYRDQHGQDLYKPSVRFFNSTLSQFIEVMWRWRAARLLLVELHEGEPDYTRPESESKVYWDQLQTCWRIILDGIENIDNQIRAEDHGSLWSEIVIDQ